MVNPSLALMTSRWSDVTEVLIVWADTDRHLGRLSATNLSSHSKRFQNFDMELMQTDPNNFNPDLYEKHLLQLLSPVDQ